MRAAAAPQRITPAMARVPGKTSHNKPGASVLLADLGTMKRTSKPMSDGHLREQIPGKKRGTCVGTTGLQTAPHQAGILEPPTPSLLRPDRAHKPQVQQQHGWRRAAWPPPLTMGRLGTTVSPDEGWNPSLSEPICFHLKRKKMPTPKLTSAMRQADIMWPLTRCTGRDKEPFRGVPTQNAQR